jgi:EmrB/QacA subfamily drug resistance transporter
VTQAPRAGWVVLAAVLGSGMAMLDATVVNVALPALGEDLGAGIDGLAWTLNGYTLTLAAFILLGGSLGDRFGRRRVFVIGTIWFALASLLCGLAPSVELLVAARALQGVGGALLTPGSLAMIAGLFEGEERGRAIGLWSGLSGLASAAGPFVGGWLIDMAGWRWVFLVNLPVGIVVLAMIWFAMKSKFTEKKHKVDYLGGALLAIATTAIVYWGDHVLDPTGPDLLTFALPVVGVAAAIWFVVTERRAEEPIVPLRLFGNHTISIVTIVSLIAGSVTLGMFFYFALYFQTITGLGPAEVGFLFLPASATSMVISMVAGRMIAATGRYKWMPVAAMAVGAALMVGFTFIDAHTPLWILALMMAVFGISMGLQFQVLMVAIQAAAPLSDIGAATGLITQARTIGASIGLAINGAVMTFALTQQNAILPADVATQLPDGLTGLSPHIASGLPEAARDVVLSHYSAGMNAMFLWVAALYVVAMGFTMLLKDVQIPKRQ